MIWCALLSLLAAPAWALSPEEAVSLTLSSAPEMAAAEGERLRAEGALRAARGLPGEPQVNASAAVVGEIWQVSVTQPVSLSGAGLAQRRAAVASVSAAEQRQRRVALELAAEARGAWSQAVVAQQRAALAADALEAAQRIDEASARREAAGEVSELERSVALLELERVRAAWMQAKAEEVEALARLSALTGVPVARLQLAADPLLAAPAPSAEAPGARSDLLAAEAEVEAARAALRRAHAQTLPPVRVGAFIEEEGPELRAGPRVIVTLPVWQRNAEERAAAEADLSLSSAELERAGRQVEAEGALTQGLSDALEAAVAEQPADLPARAQAALEDVAVGYEQGELDLLRAAELRVHILESQAAWLAGRGLVVEARLALALAQEDPRLIP